MVYHWPSRRYWVQLQVNLIRNLLRERLLEDISTLILNTTFLKGYSTSSVNRCETVPELLNKESLLISLKRLSELETTFFHALPLLTCLLQRDLSVVKKPQDRAELQRVASDQWYDQPTGIGACDFMMVSNAQTLCDRWCLGSSQ